MAPQVHHLIQSYSITYCRQDHHQNLHRRRWWWQNMICGELSECVILVSHFIHCVCAMTMRWGWRRWWLLHWIESRVQEWEKEENLVCLSRYLQVPTASARLLMPWRWLHRAPDDDGKDHCDDVSHRVAKGARWWSNKNCSKKLLKEESGERENPLNSERRRKTLDLMMKHIIFSLLLQTSSDGKVMMPVYFKNPRRTTAPDLSWHNKTHHRDV